jgi:hypothetical protein
LKIISIHKEEFLYHSKTACFLRNYLATALNYHTKNCRLSILFDKFTSRTSYHQLSHVIQRQCTIRGINKIKDMDITVGEDCASRVFAAYILYIINYLHWFCLILIGFSDKFSKTISVIDLDHVQEGLSLKWSFSLRLSTWIVWSPWISNISLINDMDSEWLRALYPFMPFWHKYYCCCAHLSIFISFRSSYFFY